MVTVPTMPPVRTVVVPVPTVVSVSTVVVQVPATPAGGAMLSVMVGVVVVISTVLAVFVVPAVRWVCDSIVALRHCRVMAVDAVYGGAADVSVVVRVGVSHPAAFLIVIPQLGW